jgi:1-deoxy-D-xylulose-5-phosphate reductoisomerase
MLASFKNIHSTAKEDRPTPRGVVILGATGSIGVSSLEIIRRFPDQFKLIGIVAKQNVDRMYAQVQEFAPAVAILDDAECAAELQRRSAQAGFACRIESGSDQVAALVARPDVDLVIAAVVGIAGLPGVFAAVRAGKKIALANKESLVAAGHLIARELPKTGAQIFPVDSEHSAIFQALQGERHASLASLTLTASGGPFFRTPLTELGKVTVAQAVKHPRWSMGAKISIDSATMVNKALELIEAHWLFGLPEEKINVVIHPQSIIHSLIELCDGSQLAQLSVPDMKGAIGYALHYPHGRLPEIMEALKLTEIERLEFFALDEQRFPAVRIARHALQSGNPSQTLAFNTLNEIAVEKFVAGVLTFLGIPQFIEREMQRLESQTYALESLEAVLDFDRALRERFKGSVPK